MPFALKIASLSDTKLVLASNSKSPWKYLHLQHAGVSDNISFHQHHYNCYDLTASCVCSAALADGGFFLSQIQTFTRTPPTIKTMTSTTTGMAMPIITSFVSQTGVGSSHWFSITNLHSTQRTAVMTMINHHQLCASESQQKYIPIIVGWFTSGRF